jgi:hydroxyacylglutathione hydrolase
VKSPGCPSVKVVIDFASPPSVAGELPVRWNSGVRRGSGDSEPPIQVHAYDEHTYILRQSKTVSFEAPFLYLLLGNERALLLDTGAVKGATPVREAVDRVVDGWLDRNPRDGYELVVLHTHGHRDHVSGDDVFADRPATTVVGTSVEEVQAYLGFNEWPDEVRTFNLGGRVLEVIGIPGHHAASIAVFDAWSGFLLTGDSVYPGRLYVEDMDAFASSMRRLVSFAEPRPVRHVMGCHVEMSTAPGLDYPMGARYQPNEPPPQMTVAQLMAVRDATLTCVGRPGVHTFDDFIIFNGMGPVAMLRLLGRTLAQRARLRPAAR